MAIETPSQRSVSILGVTGSIGASTLKVLAHAPGRFRTIAITAQENVAALARIARTLSPQRAVIGNPAHYAALKEALSGTGIKAAAGAEAIDAAAALPAEVTVAAIVGIAGLKPTLAAIDRGGVIGLANKECLVAAGALVLEAARQSGATLIPVDSEHSAIYQALHAPHRAWVEHITLTASGGPFRGRTQAELRDVTPEQAVAHPNWAMGAKISVDSATMMNKGLELIEAAHLFGLPEERIHVLVHPESIVHGLVAYQDGSMLAQLGWPDMCTPIAYALAWPQRMPAPVKALDLAQLSRLHFAAPDTENFPALPLARAAFTAGGAAPVALNAANEIAVQAFLDRRIGFLDIVKLVEKTLHNTNNTLLRGLEDIWAADGEARRITRANIEQWQG